MASAARDVKCCTNSIYNVCSGLSNTGAGFKWEYAD